MSHLQSELSRIANLKYSTKARAIGKLEVTDIVLSGTLFLEENCY
jgi:hypothetical protein